MKKISFTLILSFFILFGLKSQTVLNFNTHAPKAGDVINFLEIPFFEPGSGGHDMVWDFSKVVPLEKTKVSKQENPDKSAIDKMSITPNIVINEDDKNHLFNLTESSYEQVGTMTKDYSLAYEKPIKRMSYPFMYEDYFDGEFNGHASYTYNYIVDIYGRYTTEADAYGLLLLPGNKIKNVLRVKQYTHSTQISKCSVAEIDTYKYIWYSNDERYPLISVIITEQRFSNGETKLIQESYINEKAFTCSDDNLLAVNDNNDNSLFNYSVFPNPFKNDVNISYKLNKDFVVTVGIYDILGKRIKDIVLNEKQNQGLYTYTIGASEIGLNPGIYFIKFEIGNKVYTEKIVRSH